MKARVFEIREHEEHGALGFKPKWLPNGDPLQGMGAAHDMLEHFPNDDGSMEHELMALGASMFIRGDGGYETKYRRFDERRDVAGEFEMLWDYQIDRGRGRRLRKPPLTALPEITERTRLVIVSARKMRCDERRYEHDDDWLTDEDWEDARGWLAYGYMKARRRYREYDVWELADLFTRVQYELDAILDKDNVEGFASVKVIINLARMRIKIEGAYPK